MIVEVGEKEDQLLEQLLGSAVHGAACKTAAIYCAIKTLGGFESSCQLFQRLAISLWRGIGYDHLLILIHFPVQQFFASVSVIVVGEEDQLLEQCIYSSIPS